ncbi:MAG: hypothetical protein WBA57_08405 [Elainellaceae cyanobacterium]
MLWCVTAAPTDTLREVVLGHELHEVALAFVCVDEVRSHEPQFKDASSKTLWL